jgi:hypothetical protein
MLYVIIGMAFMFLFIGMILTEHNAQYLLSGYNTLSAQEQKKVDIKSYVAAFRRFHILLAGSFLIIELVLIYFISDVAAGIFMGAYPIIAYLYFIISSRKYFSAISGKWHIVCVVILVAILVFVSGLLYEGLRESKLIISNGTITLTGSYGEQLSASDIESVELVNQLPVIAAKSNGFGLGSIRKGYFRTSEGATVKLILNGNQSAYVLLTKSDHSKIYYSAKTVSNQHVFNDLKSRLPDIAYKHH